MKNILIVPIFILLLGVVPAYAANTYSLTLEDGLGQFAVKTSPSGLPTGNSARTIEAWVRFENFPRDEGYQMFVVDTGSQNTDQEFGLAISKKGDKYVGHLDVYNAAIIGTVDLGLTSGRWHHMAITYDGTNAKWYVDGALVETKSVGRTLNTVNAEVQIGSRVAVYVNRQFMDGEVDDVRIWNVARTQSEIENNMFSELSGSESNLVGYWKLNNNLTDETSNANNLTASNSPAYLEQIPYSLSCTYQTFNETVSGTFQSVLNWLSGFVH